MVASPRDLPLRHVGGVQTTAFKITLQVLFAILIFFVGLIAAFLAMERQNACSACAASIIWVDWLKGAPQPSAAHFKQLPPKEFDHEYSGKIIIQRMTQDELRAACPGSFKLGSWALGCATAPYNNHSGDCIVRILNEAGLNQLGWEYDIIYRHERGHCLGWHHD